MQRQRRLIRESRQLDGPGLLKRGILRLIDLIHGLRNGLQGLIGLLGNGCCARSLQLAGRNAGSSQHSSRGIIGSDILIDVGEGFVYIHKGDLILGHHFRGTDTGILSACKSRGLIGLSLL